MNTKVAEHEHSWTIRFEATFYGVEATFICWMVWRRFGSHRFTFGLVPPPDPPMVRTFGRRNHFRVLFLFSFLFSLEHVHFFVNKSQTAIFWIVFFQNDSPGQMPMLDRTGSKFCVEPRSQNLDISPMSQNPS